MKILWAAGRDSNSAGRAGAAAHSIPKKGKWARVATLRNNGLREIAINNIGSEI